MNKVFTALLEVGWEKGVQPFSIVNHNNYLLVEDTGSWIMLIGPQDDRIWDYPILQSHISWICNSIERECKIHSKLLGDQ